MLYRLAISVIICCFIGISASCQQTADSGISVKISEKYFESIDKKSQNISEALDKRSQKAVEKFQKQERRLQQKLSKIDSLAAKNIFSNSSEQYSKLKERI